MEAQFVKTLNELVAQFGELAATREIHAFALREIIGNSPELTEIITTRLEQLQGVLLNTRVPDNMIETSVRDLRRLLKDS